MKVFITLYDKTGKEAAIAKWVTARTMTAAEGRALEMRQEHLAETPHDCTLGSFTLSRRPQGDWRLNVDLAKDFHNGA